MTRALPNNTLEKDWRKTLFRRLEHAAGNLASVLLFALMIITFVDVIGRNFLNRPLPGAPELTQIFLATMVLLMLPSVSWRQDHIAVDLVDMLKSRLLSVVQQILTSVIGAVLFGVIGWRLWGLGERAGRFNDATVSLYIPLEPIFYGMSILAGATALTFAASLLRHATTPVSAEMKTAELLTQSDDEPEAEQAKPVVGRKGEG
ncbi:TRAP-type C4-dicarboxylate transport system, small permease component [Roseovarius litoreus]|uniref:TRAP transporter small permease protein n=1 Tax=Roseovarius litoreus TaxID=1155722 RepID=A0A1M7JF11_9RHOB|nr:TRAP transporter small permease [Roseovarius litoreus]SHM51548.1 TRAP-type C4-dicarboxylate transport system, small permease component [Roseovarius litoreus]